MIYLICWLVQDLLCVLTWGIMQIPEIFLLSLVYRLMTQDREMSISIIWWAFFGGLFWDLRWVGIPGLYTLIYVCTVMLTLWVWNTLPASGRTPVVIFFLFWTTQVLSPLLTLLLPGRNIREMEWTFFAVQQGCVVPLALLGLFFYLKHVKDHNA
ncbi:MAG: hypothetical protein LBR61_03065 [Synergistaceae bacterium]|jgi:hypothetical protein|nr:hypothetical protein [Synergistaceae bacterium]